MKTFLTALAALAVATSYAVAEDAKPAAPADKPAPNHAEKGKEGEGRKHEPGDFFKKLDTNNDQSISLDEFKAGPKGQKDPAKAEEIFKRKDANGDGKLTLEEFTAHGGKKGEKGEKGEKKGEKKEAK